MLSGIFSVACFLWGNDDVGGLFRHHHSSSFIVGLSFAPFGGYAEEDLEVYAGHGARED